MIDNNHENSRDELLWIDQDELILRYLIMKSDYEDLIRVLKSEIYHKDIIIDRLKSDSNVPWYKRIWRKSRC